MTSTNRSPTFNHETVPGLFLQDDPNTDAEAFDFTKQNFGLIERDYPSQDEVGSLWSRFEGYIESCNKQAPRGTRYTLFYLGRHGEGYHNVAEAFYGTKAWDEYWSKLEGNDEMFWADAHLTELGRQQALNAHAFFAEQLRRQMPAPQRYFVSPLYRCLQTADLTFSGLDLPPAQPFAPQIKELLREVLGEHTCDRRSTRSKIQEAFPKWEIEPGFTEEDVLWQAEHRETDAEHDARSQRLLDKVLSHETSTVISFTCHSGTIASLLRVVGHREFQLATGAMIPLLIKSTRMI